ncbi:uncharacterized protein LY89DRAFT_683944 [Mollisia scopiformis]|uniref:Phosphoglycerate mutase-like protein n=1 Tax=Mollisia scopiformis TaxID=149040 RepID=A0A194XCT5_MOLSC|nr:uncharacterized protein LY89DRAFT_683944 [Mollisia scopiformis]KUJ17985.1 hypothetical protein LY89DRAFT_683944 [Mollisia scopiformis]
MCYPAASSTGPKPKSSDYPPTIIVHIVRHAHATFNNGNDMSASVDYAGERQCDDLARTFSRDNEGITHILCSPYKRCIDTARKSLRSVINNGVKIDLMRSLSGRETDNKDWVDGIKFFEESSLHEMGRWIQRDSKATDLDFVRGWLSLKEMNLAEAQKMKEVVVVTHERFLEKLFRSGSIRYHRFGLAEARTYRLTPGDGTLVAVGPHELKQLRKAQGEWASALALQKAIEEIKRSEALLAAKITADLKAKAEAQGTKLAQDTVRSRLDGVRAATLSC